MGLVWVRIRREFSLSRIGPCSRGSSEWKTGWTRAIETFWDKAGLKVVHVDTDPIRRVGWWIVIGHGIGVGHGRRPRGVWLAATL